MNTNIEHTGFEEKFRESFNDFTPEPHPAVWERVEAGLKRRNRIIFLYRTAAAASILLLFSISGWMFMRSYDQTKLPPDVATYEAPAFDSSAEITEISEPKAEETPVPTQRDVKPQKEKVPVPPAVIEKPEIAIAEPKEKETDFPELSEPIAALDDFDVEPVEVPPLADQEDIATEKTTDEVKPLIAEQKMPELHEIDFLLNGEDYLPEKTKEKSWLLALGYGTLPGQSGGDASSSYESTSANFSRDPFSSKLSGETDELSTIETTNYSQPLTFGLVLHRNYSDIWGIETGLLFTWLKTTSTTTTQNDEFSEYGSEILYIGLPLSVRLNMISGRRFGMYISQGAVVEKGVRARHYSSYYVSDILQSSEEDTYVVEGVQVSSLTALGFEYRITKQMGVYLQPGLQVFFLNETQPYNIRSSSAIWPSIQMGLKFKLQ